ncbi:hypothetical protein A8926_2103 [Saccharopolyspora spinosa]|uniref:Uncharacterized protein n=2 Tax=Saccharopolyspora spinosa TaxID=60894 RepID=A0A2N3XUX7_SACSN|nr:hypothetical protein A8926_2103 [Saccharopolyspora spinosa]
MPDNQPETDDQEDSGEDMTPVYDSNGVAHWPGGRAATVTRWPGRSRDVPRCPASSPGPGARQPPGRLAFGGWRGSTRGKNAATEHPRAGAPSVRTSTERKPMPGMEEVRARIAQANEKMQVGITALQHTNLVYDEPQQAMVSTTESYAGRM